ncbi:hypothetical protein AAG906_011555 [Vitis piasezkii]
MASNKERIEQLEAGIGSIHDNVSRIEMGMADKFQQLETTLHRLMEAVSISREEVVGSTGGRRRDSHHSGRAESSTPMFQSKFAKLEFPRFAVGDPTMWLTKVKQFFDYQETPGTQKVQYAAYHLEDEANEWWQATKRAYAEEETEITWEVFEEELWARFGPTECEDFDEALSKIKQAGTFRDYQREFERLVNKVQGWTQKALVGTFMGGLHPAIADGIRMFRPKSLKEAISLARMKDEQLQRQRRTQPNTPQIQRNTQQNSKGPLTTKRLSWEEIRKKRSLGLCFSCDERYTPGHKCRQPQLLLMEGESGWESSEMEEPLVEQEPEISLYALAGWSESRTMRIYAQIGQHQLVALIDSGSTHNFISEKMATMLQLPVVPTRPFPVRVANGTPMQCRWKYETGLRTTPIQPVEFQCLSKEARQGHALFAIYATEEGNSTPVLQELKELIEAFDDIFHIEHQITLEEGTDPINVRPYRYAYFQKDEIERQVSDMLNSGLIRPSSSPFSSPVLLVKKKDGSWRAYFTKLDLTAVTIKCDFIHDIYKMAFEHTTDTMNIYCCNTNSLSNLKMRIWETRARILRPYHFCDGVKVDQSKIQAMLDWPRPTTSELRAFLGLLDITLVHSLISLKGKISWDEVAKKAIENLKAAMTTTPTGLTRLDSPFVIQTDAWVMELVLSYLEWAPIAFMSRALGVSKQSLSIYAREMLAIIVHHSNRPVSLKYLLEQRILTLSNRIQTGKTNQATMHFPNMTSPCLNVFFPRQPYQWRNGLVCYNNRIVVPPGSPLIHLLLREFHDTPMGGHSGILRTYKRLSQQFYWPSMRRSVHQYVAACDVCQKAKAETMSPAGLLQPLPIPCQVWDDITMDFIDGLPRSDGKTSIMVVVDRLSKSAHFIAIAHPYTAKTIANKFVEWVVKLHEFLKLSGTKLRMTSAYHPQSDGQTEVVNRCIEQYLRCFVHHKPRHWNSLLPWAEYWYNTTYHSSTGMTPFQALYGRPPPAIPSYEIGSCPIEELDDQMTARDELLQELKAHLHAANNRMKQAADKKWREVNFEVGDWVYLRLQPYRQQSVFRRTSHKLSNRYYGPYQIEERIGPVAYKLKLSPGSRIHPVFHFGVVGRFTEEEATWEDSSSLAQEVPTKAERHPNPKYVA